MCIKAVCEGFSVTCLDSVRHKLWSWVSYRASYLCVCLWSGNLLYSSLVAGLKNNFLSVYLGSCHLLAIVRAILPVMFCAGKKSRRLVKWISQCIYVFCYTYRQYKPLYKELPTWPELNLFNPTGVSLFADPKQAKARQPPKSSTSAPRNDHKDRSVPVASCILSF